ncbi:MAG: alpha-1,2-fucosyltransferase [Bauldia litoralis]
MNAGKRSYQLDNFNLPRDVTLARDEAIEKACRTYREPGFQFDPGLFDLAPPVRLEGYFISGRYFSTIAEEVRLACTPRRPLSRQADDYARRISATPNAVSVHLRRGDYLSPTIAHLDPLPLDYYQRALAALEERVDGQLTCFVFTDDPAYAAEHMGFLPNRVLVDGDINNPWESLIQMRLCRRHVIANSTFSWWGAWLSETSERVVIAPRDWHTPAYMPSMDTRDVCPEEWILV